MRHIPIPKPEKGELLVKVRYASICGTDIGIYTWTPWVAGHLKPPIVIGHEVVGEIVQINGDPGDLKIGDLVSSETHIFDDTCYQCHIGNRHICENVKFFGYQRNGGFAEYATIPTRTSWKNSKKIPIEAMSVQEPLGNSVHVVSKANVCGKKVLVLGLGATGLCAALVAQHYGAQSVTAVNRGEYRRKLALKMGVERCVEAIPKAEMGSYDIVLEMSGSVQAIRQAMQAVRIGGLVMAFGIPKQEVSFDWGRTLIDKEITIKSVFGRQIWKTWHQTKDLLETGKIDLKKIITHRFALDDFEKAMQVMISGKCGKVLLEVNK